MADINEITLNETIYDLNVKDGKITEQKLSSELQGKISNALKPTDIADNLTTDDATKVLSAKQGKALNDKFLNGDGYGQQSIPTEALEQTVAGFNKYNPADPDIVEGKHLGASGFVTNADARVSGFIPASPGDIMEAWAFISRTSTKNQPFYVRWKAFDIDKNAIADSYVVSAKTYAVPQGAAYIRFSTASSEPDREWKLGHYMIIVGPSTATNIPFEPYSLILDVRNIRLSQQNNDAGFMALVKNTVALPPIIAFAGHSINIYHGNIVDYAKGGYFFRLSSENRGVLGNKKWTYTPDSAETFGITLEYLDTSKRVLNQLYNIPVNVVASSQKSSLKVLVIGDSTVNLATSLPEGGETQKMLDLAADDGYVLTLLGTRGVGLNQHEGRGGWTAKMLCTQASTGTTQNAFFNPSTQTFDFSYYMSQQGYSGVDCVFIQFGINDMTSFGTSRITNDETCAEAIEDMFTYMDEIISSIHTYDSNIKVVVNSVIPCTDNQDIWENDNQPCWRHKRNTYLLNVASIAHYADIPNVYLSWYGASFDIEKLGDGVHPTQEGFNELGEQMYSYMRAIN